MLQKLNDTSFINNYGYTSLTEDVKTNQESYFKIGSCTKTFTAIAIMQLVEKGKIDLNTPVEHYLEEIRFRRPDSYAPITVHHLLAHTSGLREEIANGLLSDKKEEGCMPEDIINDTLLLKPDYLWAYSNAGYGILGCAGIASKIARAIHLAPNSQITCVASRSLEKAQNFVSRNCPNAEAMTYDELILSDKCQIIYIPIPTALRLPWIVKAIEQVFCYIYYMVYMVYMR